jgi:transposase InsO family protein
MRLAAQLSELRGGARAVRRWIGWYNERRPHQALGYLSARQYRASQLQRVA